jgi:hypothetical protein
MSHNSTGLRSLSRDGFTSNETDEVRKKLECNLQTVSAEKSVLKDNGT